MKDAEAWFQDGMKDIERALSRLGRYEDAAAALAEAVRPRSWQLTDRELLAAQRK